MIENELSDELQVILRPLAHLMLTNKVSYSDFVTASTRAFVDVAATEKNFEIPGRKQTASRISVLTGINRKTVAKILDEDNENSTVNPASKNRAVRVISHWRHNKEYTDRAGKPKPLAVGKGDKDGSFEKLVKFASGGITPRAILDELIDSGTVTLTKDKVKLNEQGYVPEVKSKKIKLGYEAIADLIHTITHNITLNVDGTEKFQRTLVYDKVTESGANAFLEICRYESGGLLRKLHGVLREYDREANPNLEETAGENYRTGIGIYLMVDKNVDE